MLSLARLVNLLYNWDMESITLNIRDISLPDKLALEHVIGQQLAEHQQVVIQICSLEMQPEKTDAEQPAAPGLPERCNVYVGLTDDQISAFEQTVLQRADLTRATD